MKSVTVSPGIGELLARIRPRRTIQGMSAVLLPFDEAGAIDWRAFAAHIERTVAAGLVPAVNMDTGYGQLLDEAERKRAIALANCQAGERFLAGVHVADGPGDPFDLDAYRVAANPILEQGGTPVVFPSHGLNALPGEDWAAAYAALGEHWPRFIAFELGPMFVAHGRIFEVTDWRHLLTVPQCIGAKHSSLSRALEWDRLALRDELRPDFLVLTGNDLAIDMVMYGSDYLLGLSTFAPDLFAQRDAWWAAGDARFYQRNDDLQALGDFAFREPVPAYRHDAAMFLHWRGQIASGRTHPGAPERPASDREILVSLGRRLGLEGS